MRNHIWIFLFSILIVPPLALSAETDLPQTSIKKINEDFLDNYQVKLSCSRGVAYPQVDLFAKGENIFMLRDSNSSVGYSVAELREAGSGEYYHSGGMRFSSSNLANTNDFYISAETLKKGEGELTVVLYRDIYKCDAKLDTWSVNAAERAVEREIQAVIEELKLKMLAILERAVHQKLIQDFNPPTTAPATSKAIYRINISKKDGLIGSIVPLELSQDVSFNSEATRTLKHLKPMEDLELDKEASKLVYEQMEQTGMNPDSVFGVDDSPVTLYIELNMTGEFVPVPQELRR
ncbi:MAG: hypothetical protein HWE12_07810 [Oceanospirillaceae bacterium]|nr:hypothetical protein [Oceanospirillaceae bacterium]